MPFKAFSGAWAAVLAVILFALVAPARAQKEIIVHSFGGTDDATAVNGGLVSDAVGNLYGSATGGGRYGNGVVFELSPQADGSWAESFLYDFGPPRYGYYPNAQVSFDPKGNLYGTTTAGGAYSDGTVYKLSPITGGGWTAQTAHNFNPAVGDGNAASGVDVVADAAGNVFGSNWESGLYGNGFVFGLKADNGGWKETILQNFNLGSKGGYYPGNLVLDAAGNVYGTAQGGVLLGGVVFRFMPASGGGSSETMLYNFSDNDPEQGAVPVVVAFDASGNLYGLTLVGGTFGHGVAFELTPTVHGEWMENVLYSFEQGDGDSPSGLVIDAPGNLYVTMASGGGQGWGTALKLSPASAGIWTKKRLHNFGSGPMDGLTPGGTLVVDPAGNLFGSTYEGGIQGGGIVYEIVP
jgi:uncharacterized repeat protein (TIGR03803 family)